jgi:hypothetical protein
MFPENENGPLPMDYRIDDVDMIGSNDDNGDDALRVQDVANRILADRERTGSNPDMTWDQLMKSAVEEV